MTDASGGDTKITVWTFLDPEGSSGREVVLGKLIDSFEEENPDVTVEVQVQQWDTMTTQFLAADASGAAPDVVWAIVDQVSNVVEQGALADLNSLVFDDFSDEELADLSSVYWDGMQTEAGKMYGVVHHRNYFGLIYRSDYLTEAGIEPSSIRTWDNLIEVARQFTDPEESRWGLGQAFSTSFADPQIFVAKLLEEQGTLFDDDGSPMWATEAGVEALEFQVDLIEQHEVTSPDAVRLTIEDLYELFAAGQYATASSAVARVTAMQAQLGPENVSFMPYPSEDGKKPAPGVLTGWSVGVWDGSPVKEKAAEFVAHISSKEADEMWMLEAQQPPLYSSTAEENAEFLSRPENDFLNAVIKGSEESGWLPPIDVPTVAWREPLNTAVQGVLLDGLTPMEALERAEAEALGGQDE